MNDYPSRFGGGSQYSNPEGTLPLPSPGNVPRPLWVGDRQRFNWSVLLLPVDDPPDPVGVTYQYVWQSPTFDLRPDLRSAQGAPKDGVPIWSTAARLYIQIAGDPSRGTPPVPGTQPVLNMAGTVVEANEWVNISTNYSSDRRPGEGITGGAGLLSLGTFDASAAFTALPGATTVMVPFSPPGTGAGGGDGYPVRYWRLRLTFTHFIETGLPAPVPLPTPDQNAPGVIWASVY